MKSLTITGKIVRVTAFAVIFVFCGSAWAGEHGDGSWWLGRSGSSAGGGFSLGSITNFSGGKGGKAVTKTEVFGGKSVLPMVSPTSDEAMSNAVAHYEIIVSRGGWPEVSGSSLARGSSGPEVVRLRQRLIAESYLPSEASAAENSQEYSDAVLRAVAQFQANHGLEVTGKVDKATADEMNVPASERLATLKANVPRMREYSKDLGPRYIIVNIPALQLEAVNFNSVFSRHNIIAGQPSRPTPVTLTQISDINFNPYWNAPVSIVEKDIIPRVQREGTRVLRDMNMRIYDGYNGPEVNPDDVDWDNVPPDRFYFRQEPGAENAMASVKINFPSPFGIYLHDTPTKSLFTVGARYLSSGCVRVDQVHVLVNWILNGQDGWNPARIEATAASHERLDVKVKDGPQLRTVYLTAWATPNGQVSFRNDIYDLDKTSFVVGQPLAPGEYSDDGHRFVLKPVVRQASASFDDEEYYKPHPRSHGFGLFSFSRERSSGPSLLPPGRRDDGVSFITNFSNGPQQPPAKKTLLKGAKVQAAGDKVQKKKKLHQTLQLGEKTTDKTTKVASVKKKPIKTRGDTVTAEKSAASGDVKKKKKKVEVTTASPVPNASKPIFTQQ